MNLPTSASTWARRAVDVCVAAAVTAGAGIAAVGLWDRYELWTRDGRVRAEVVQIAHDVSGLVTSVYVHDNVANDQVRLFMTLGGGWEEAQHPPATATR